MRRAVLLVGALSVMHASSAQAQTGGASNRAAAEALFNQGRALVASGHLADACPKFEASEQLDPGLGTLLNLADCYEKLGKTASAWAEYREAIPLARAAGSAVRQKFATQRAQALESRLSTLTIRATTRGEEGSTLDIRRDGIPVQAAELGSPIPVDPGPHTVEAVAPGKQKWSSEVQVADASKIIIEIPALLPVASSAAPSGGAEPIVAPPLERAPQPGAGSSQRTLAVAVGVVGLAGVAVGTVFGLSASSKWSDAKAHCSAYPYGCDAQSIDAQSSAKSRASISTVAFIAGGVALGGAALLYFTAGRGKEKNMAIGIAPAGAFLRGSF